MSGKGQSESNGCRRSESQGGKAIAAGALDLKDPNSAVSPPPLSPITRPTSSARCNALRFDHDATFSLLLSFGRWIAFKQMFFFLSISIHVGKWEYLGIKQSRETSTLVFVDGEGFVRPPARLR